VNGMYMPADHDHEKWAAQKKKKFLAIKADKKKRKSESTDKDGTERAEKKQKTSPSKLALNKILQKALTTRLQVSDKECIDIFNEAYAEAADTDADGTSKK